MNNIETDAIRIASIKRAGVLGFHISRDGSAYALTSRPHHGRVVGRVIWIGSVLRKGSGWAAYDTRDRALTGFSRQQDAGKALYSAWLAS